MLDYICTPSDVSVDESCFWVIVNESCYASDDKDTFFQPYILKRCTFNWFTLRIILISIFYFSVINVVLEIHLVLF